MKEFDHNTAGEIIAELRDRKRLLEIEIAALRASCESYRIEAAEKVKQVDYWTRRVKEAEA